MLGHLTHEQIEEVLRSNILGRIGCSDQAQTYIVPINYIYDGKTIIAHSLPGMKIEMMRKNPKVCFEVDEVKSFTDWKSVVVHGTYEEITDEQERYKAMSLFVQHTLRLKISETAVLPELSENRVHPRSPGNIKMIVYRINPVKKTGRFEIN